MLSSYFDVFTDVNNDEKVAELKKKNLETNKNLQIYVCCCKMRSL